MKTRTKIMAVLGLLALCSVGIADELLVPSEYPTIQSAIDDANEGDTVLVADGVYTGDGNRDIDFLGKAITVRSTNPNDPNIIATTIIDCNGTWLDSHRGFIFDSNESHDSVLSGITITNGDFRHGNGGAIYCDRSSPTISKCRIINNEAAYGGGIACIDSNAILSNCIVKGNYTEGCGSNGGGIYCRSSGVLIKQCIITENDSRDRQGGGILCHESDCTITQCLIFGNKCGERGGGIACISDSNVAIRSCSIADNRSYGAGGISVYRSYATVENSILWGNRATYGNQIGLRGSFDDKGEIALNYCDIEELEDGVYIDWQGELNLETGNINENPIFIQQGQWNDNATPNWLHDDFFLGDGDYHLKSEGWRWDSDANQWTWDEVTSRCIDAGNPGSPLGDEPLTLVVDPLNRWGENLRVNMGAYGGTSEASMPPYDWAILGDLTNDGLVNLKDYAFQTADWRNSADQQPGDLNRDSLVDISDVALLVEDWLRQTT